MPESSDTAEKFRDLVEAQAKAHGIDSFMLIFADPDRQSIVTNYDGKMSHVAVFERALTAALSLEPPPPGA